MSDKVYCGSGFTGKDFGNTRVAVNIRVYLDDVPDEHIVTDTSGKRYIKLNVVPKRTPVEGKPDYYVCVDTWEPTKTTGQTHVAPLDPATKRPDVKPKQKEYAEEELPF